MRMPSVKTLQRIEGITLEQAKKVRAVLEEHNFFSKPFATMRKVNVILGFESVEEVPEGEGSRSPSFLYINDGDLYKTTLCYYNGNFTVTYPAYFIERGNYA